MATFKLGLNPIDPNYGRVGDLQIMVHAPLLKIGRTKQAQPHLHDFFIDNEHPEGAIRRVLVSFMDPELDEYEFDLDTIATHQIRVKNKNYEVTLAEIGEEEILGIQGQKFLYFIFYAEEK